MLATGEIGLLLSVSGCPTAPSAHSWSNGSSTLLPCWIAEAGNITRSEGCSLARCCKMYTSLLECSARVATFLMAGYVLCIAFQCITRPLHMAVGAF